MQMLEIWSLDVVWKLHLLKGKMMIQYPYWLTHFGVLFILCETLFFFFFFWKKKSECVARISVFAGKGKSFNMVSKEPQIKLLLALGMVFMNCLIIWVVKPYWRFIKLIVGMFLTIKVCCLNFLQFCIFFQQVDESDTQISLVNIESLSYPSLLNLKGQMCYGL